MTETTIHALLPPLVTAFIAAALMAPTLGARPAAAQQASGGAVLRQACAADYRAFCTGVQFGGGRVLQCLHDHRNQLSPGCRDALAAAAGILGR